MHDKTEMLLNLQQIQGSWLLCRLALNTAYQSDRSSSTHNL